MRILLTFTGFHDPFTPGPLAGEEQPGPILSLVRNMAFDEIILFDTPNTTEQTAATQGAVEEEDAARKIKVVHLSIPDPTDHLVILRELRQGYSSLGEDTHAADLSISVSSGTPAMHACWFLLAASGEIPATVLQTCPPRFVTAERPSISEIDLSAPGIPRVRSGACPLPPEVSEVASPDPDDVLRRMGIIGQHAAMQRCLETVTMIAASDEPLLILGETGTGKELLARYTHLVSDRSGGPFVAINCAAIPASLVESMLFGHRKGAFTGADRDVKGKFEQADGGTLFLDEVGELPLEVQGKFLRVLQEGLVDPVGGDATLPVNVRIVAATNVNMPEVVAAGTFRSDLYYRLNVGLAHMPPLRERRSDIPLISLSIMDRTNARSRRKKQLSREALRVLQSRDWPGNVRDLENVIRRSALLTRGEVITVADLDFGVIAESERQDLALPDISEGFSMTEHLATTRAHLIRKALALSDGNQSQAARLLGITPQAVQRFLRSSDS
jgi:DNA-binding NtrC family response regulator